VVSWAFIIRNVHLDNHYPNATIWSKTLPFDGSLFVEDLHENAMNVKDASKEKAKADTSEENADEENTHLAKIVRTVSD
jgi:hypothetical protein